MKKTRILCAALALIIALLALSLSSCSKKSEIIMSISDGKIEKTVSLNTYTFLLSRMRGTLDFYGYDVEDKDFWRTIISTDGKTWDDHFSDTIFEQTKLYLIVEYLFELEGLTLDAGREAHIEKTMQKILDAEGSLTKLNSNLKAYGVNADMLREIYVIEQKFSQLIEYYYGADGERIEQLEKDKYYSENYVAFGQIFLPTYEVITGENGKDETRPLDAEAKAAVADKAKQYAEECSGRTNLFREYCAEHSGIEGSGEPTYLFVQSEYYGMQDASAAYLDTIAKELDKMAVGETRVVASPYGYHVICRYEREANAYDNEKYAESFSDFYAMLSDKLFDEKCSAYSDDITVSDDVKRPMISTVKSNKLY